MRSEKQRNITYITISYENEHALASQLETTDR
jgi:hypothetical protein